MMAAQTYRPATNGAAVFAIHLAEGLARAGHQLSVLMPSDRRLAYRATLNGVQVRAVTALPLAPLYPKIHVTLLPGPEVRRLVDELRPDVVHIQDHYPLSRAVVGASRRRGLPLVGTNNFLPDNMAPQVPVLFRSRGFLGRLLWAMVLEVFNRADVVTAATETSAGILRRQGIRPPVYAISCGVDLERFHPDPGIERDVVRRRYGLDPRKAVLLYVGRLDPEKRLDVLLQAARRLGRDDVQLAIAGRGAQAKALRGLAERLGLGQSAVFVGFVPGRDLPALLNSVDIFTMASEAELQSLATLEAMATGRPVLLADALALPELVQSGTNGYLFRAGDAEDAARRIAQLLAERERWPEMGEASLAMARPHSIANTVRRYEELYTSLLEAAPAEAGARRQGAWGDAKATRGPRQP